VASDRDQTTGHAGDPPAPDDLVKTFLKGQNLEQVGRVEEAIELYESVVAESFDSAGPYDRLIFLYTERGRPRDVIRVAQASLEAIRTYPEKENWYRQQIEGAEQALGSAPDPR
jgi:hypothetical protein